MLKNKVIIKEKISQLQVYAIPLLRVSMALVFLYFGISQVINPQAFIGWLPSEASIIPLAPQVLVIINGLFEIFFGTLLFIGLHTRLSSLLLGGHLFVITLSIGFTEIGVRDFGLAMATLALVIMEPSKYSLDEVFSKSEF